MFEVDSLIKSNSDLLFRQKIVGYSEVMNFDK